MHSHTVENVTQLLNDPKYRKMFLNGSYPTIDQYPKNIGSGKMATAISRIAQLLSGHKFENFSLEDFKIKPNNFIGNKIQNKMFFKLLSPIKVTLYYKIKLIIKI